MEQLSNIELYYTNPENIKNAELQIVGEEVHHIAKVMRHSPGDEVFVTDGVGNIYEGKIISLKNDLINVQITTVRKYEKNYENFVFCIPKLKSSDRLEFALEKSVELGITNFIIFNSERTISKSIKTHRLEKILLSAMKQSLRAFLPKIISTCAIEELSNLKGKKLVFEQSAAKYFVNFILNKNEKNYFIFGPEGGLSSNELELFNMEELYKLAENRLRTETAVIKCASTL